MLEVVEAAGLRGVCKALKGLVMEWPMRLGERLFGRLLRNILKRR
jgi:hypothetical protein